MQSRIQVQAPEVHVWTLPIPPVVENIREHFLFSFLSPPERERHNAMGSPERQREYLLSHALARMKVAELLEMEPADMPLVFEEGKGPRFLPTDDGRRTTDEKAVASIVPAKRSSFRPSYHISLSHTRALIACALAPFPVGVDVEPVGREAHLDDVACRMFHPDEAAEIAALTGDAKKERFTQYWTLREAFYKASGMNLSEIREGVLFTMDEGRPLATLAGTTDEKAVASPRPSSLRPSWHFSLAHPAPDHILALAVASGEEVGVEFHKVGIEELI